MLINTKYNFGDKVYIIKEQRKQDCCKMCKGKKEISVNEILSNCPRCYGQGIISLMEKELVVKGPFQISGIQVYNFTGDGLSVFYTLPHANENIYSIPSIVEEDRLFLTYEEASEYI